MNEHQVKAYALPCYVAEQTLDPASWPQLIGKQVYSVHLTANVGLE